MDVRGSGNYQASIMSDDFIRSLKSVYVGDLYLERAKKLKEDVQVMLSKTRGTLDQLELVDALKRLGISYHFGDEIEKILETIYTSHNNVDKLMEGNLYAAALKFRLLREHGYQIIPDIFHTFMDKNGDFKASLCQDIKGLLYLYEASYLSVEDERILDVARDFTTRYLKESLETNKCQVLEALVKHALELPLYWRMFRLETKWFINEYEKMPGMNSTLLELAKLDFNMVQAKYQKEIQELSKWYKEIGLAEKMRFARDQLFEYFLWAVGFSFEPHFGYCRKILTKLAVFITTIDDMYDSYGTLHELELFTDAIERWEINAMEQLPDYMKICFLALFNSVNEIAYDILKERGVNIISHLHKTWAELCNSYLVEAKWCNSGYIPSLREYLDNGWISSTGPLITVHAYFCITNAIRKDTLDEGFERFSDIIRQASVILRLVDDLRIAPDEMQKGDNPKSMHCYMHENGACEDDARNYIKYLIRETWKKVNKVTFSDCAFSNELSELGKNFNRTAQCVYQYGEGFRIPNHNETRKNLISLVVEPISLP